jgi:hypothetical protein
LILQHSGWQTTVLTTENIRKNLGFELVAHPIKEPTLFSSKALIALFQVILHHPKKSVLNC